MSISSFYIYFDLFISSVLCNFIFWSFTFASIMSFVLTDFLGKIECLSSLNNIDAGVNPVAGCISVVVQ